MAQMIAKYPASMCPTCDCTTPLADCSNMCRGITDLPAAGGWPRTQADLRAHMPLCGCVQRIHVVHLRRQPWRLACGSAATAAQSKNVLVYSQADDKTGDSSGHLQGIACQVWMKALSRLLRQYVHRGWREQRAAVPCCQSVWSPTAASGDSPSAMPLVAPLQRCTGH